MDWKLNKVEDIECTMDNSGVYTVINRVMETKYGKGAGTVLLGIRVDILATDGNLPLQSFQGTGNAVRKHVIRWLNEYEYRIIPDKWVSIEHASYIGYEIARAEADQHYIQS